MWTAKRHGWRAVVFAACCSALIMYAGSVGAQLAAEPPPPGAPERDGAAAASSGWFGWGLPPVRWGGSLVTEMRADRSGDQSWRRQQNEIASIKAGSYLWQPWFAQVSGGLGLLLSKERSDDRGALAANQARDASSTAVTGNAELALFPISRFPFNAYFEVSDSRASGDPMVNNLASTRFGLRQSYQPPEGNANYAASFNRSTLESAAFGRDTVNALAASMNRNIGAQSFDLSGIMTRNTRSATGESAALTQLTGRHSYRPEPALSIESLASASSSNFHLISGGALIDNRSQFAQANTFVTWRPEEGSPLSVTGGGRMFRSMIADNAGETEALTLSGNIAATYALTHQTNISGSAMVTQLLSDAADSVLTAQAASVTHISDPVGFLGFAYTWNAGANIANETGLLEGNRQTVGSQLGHSVTRSLTLREGSDVNFNLGQSVGAAYDTVNARSQTLGHNAGVSWRLTRSAATSAYLSALATDSRTAGHNANRFQMINFQASGQTQLSRNSVAAANLTVQGVRQSMPTTPSAGLTFYSSSPGAGFNFYTSGNLSYQHLRAFDVPRLRYTALYSVNEWQYQTRLQGNVDAPLQQVTQSFEQRLDYFLGRVATRLSLRIAEIEGRREVLVFLRVSREFGAF